MHIAGYEVSCFEVISMCNRFSNAYCGFNSAKGVMSIVQPVRANAFNLRNSLREFLNIGTLSQTLLHFWHRPKKRSKKR